MADERIAYFEHETSEYPEDEAAAAAWFDKLIALFDAWMRAELRVRPNSGKLQ